MPSYLSYQGATKYLAGIGVDIAEQTLRRMVSERRIPHTKLSKRVFFDSSRLDSWLASRAVEPAEPARPSR